MTNPAFVLRLSRAGQPPTEYEFEKERVTVGRDVADVALHDPGCSSRHAELLFADGQVVLRDVGSTNGTWLGTRRITNERMNPGVKFTIGSTTLELLAVRGVEPEPGRTLVMPGPGGAIPARTERKLTPAPGRATVALQRRNLIGAALAAVALFFLLRGGNSPGDGNGGGNRTPRLQSERQATVRVVWFKGPAGPEASGGSSPTTVRITPNDKEGARVGIVEQFAGGAGNQWKTAAWLAAFSSTQRTGQSLVDYEFLVETAGQIDGPSAGMLITATMIAILRGKTPRADTTMTGTINPDGSAGPVGGIVQKMDGAKRDGLKRFGFPLGARTHVDLRTGKTVDLLVAAKEFDLEAREIRDVFEAYEFLTGDRLERPSPVADAEMDLDADTSARLRTKNDKWKARVKGEVANIGAAARGLGSVGAVLQPIAEQADTFSKRADEYERSDFLAAAYDSYVQAAIFATITKERARFLKAGDDVDDMVAQAEAAASVQGQLTALSSEVELEGKRTGGGQINALRASQALVIAECYATLGAAAAASAGETRKGATGRRLNADELKSVKQGLEQAIVLFTIARTLLDVASDQRDFGNEQGQSAPIPSEVIARSAAAYGSAAGAVLGYLESLAGQQSTSGDEDFLIALRAKNRVVEMTTGSNLLRLAAGSLSFLKGASLVNKYYSLGGEVDAAGTLTLTNIKALGQQLDLARQLAREAAQKAKARVGFVPVAARLAYQLGVARRERDDKQKIQALEAFWESAFWSELAASSPPIAK
jgi:predicted S18 family serine protease